MASVKTESEEMEDDEKELQLDLELGDDEGDDEQDLIGQAESEEASEPSIEKAIEDIPTPPQNESRASRRIRQEIEKRKVLEKRSQELEQQLYRLTEAATRREQPPAAPQVSPEEEARRLEYMSEPERVAYYVNKATSQQLNEVNQLKAMMQFQADATAFQSFLSANPTLRKYADRVEEEFERRASKGSPTGRQLLIKEMIADEVIRNSSRAVRQAKQRGQENIRRQQSAPPGGGSGFTQASSGRSQESALDTLKRRLANREYG